LLAATLYQGMHDWNHKLWNIGSTEIYIPYAGAAGMLLHINGKFTMAYSDAAGMLLHINGKFTMGKFK